MPRPPAAALLALGLAALPGCYAGAEPPPWPLGEGGGKALSDAPYPAGPYGVGEGSIIKNYAFTGYANPAKAHTLVPISLGDFYNPTGEGLYAEASPFEADKPRPRVLLIDVAARWCAPCQQEAKEILPAAHAKLAPLGAEFLLDLADGIEPGSVATQKDLDKWTTAFAVDYPAVFDPDYQLGALFDASSFPVNIVIDTREMRIATVVKGILDESFWTEIESLLDK